MDFILGSRDECTGKLTRFDFSGATQNGLTTVTHEKDQLKDRFIID